MWYSSCCRTSRRPLATGVGEEVGHVAWGSRNKKRASGPSMIFRSRDGSGGRRSAIKDIFRRTADVMQGLPAQWLGFHFRLSLAQHNVTKDALKCGRRVIPPFSAGLDCRVHAGSLNL